MVELLPKFLQDVIPCSDLIGLLRDPEFSKAIFHCDIGWASYKWPEQADSLYPADLIRLWEDQKWIAQFAMNLDYSLILDEDKTPRSLQLDPIYHSIFSEHPDALLVVQTLILPCSFPVHLHSYASLLNVFYLSLHMLRPLLVLRKMGSPSHVGKAVAVFIMDSKRAGSLYRHPYKMIEDWMVHWARYAQQGLDCCGERLDTLRLGLWLVKYCKPGSAVHRGFDAIDLSHWCRQPDPDFEVHAALHQRFLNPEDFKDVLNWLSCIDPPPTTAIASWRRQLGEVERCAQTHEA
ncbi:hypothetical protein MVEN_01579600 [Mycena venus]|uniref:Uncharacterized protein n=1 Tax=Mycena venus TaxID=2733690 RepID=A0A8H6XSH7_9AGAR|nr:hypothetical protein MVEN_01579600 [Mycena venus]